MMNSKLEPNEWVCEEDSCNWFMRKVKDPQTGQKFTICAVRDIASSLSDSSQKLKELRNVVNTLEVLATK